MAPRKRFDPTKHRRFPKGSSKGGQFAAKFDYWDQVSEARINNDYPPESSNWHDFSKKFDIGVLDLDNFAYAMGFENFNDLDISISPKRLFERDNSKFVYNLRESSIKAAKSDDALDEVLSFFSTT